MQVQTQNITLDMVRMVGGQSRIQATKDWGLQLSMAVVLRTDTFMILVIHSIYFPASTLGSGNALSLPPLILRRDMPRSSHQPSLVRR